MKNLFLIPTPDKPRFDKYLVLNKESKFCVWDTETMGFQNTLIPQNIYIIDCCYDFLLGYVLNVLNNTVHYIIPDNSTKELLSDPKNLPISAVNKTHYFKIILTTDVELKNGVQAIDDNFLKWFVENSSCTHVFFKKNILFRSVNYYFYEIIVLYNKQDVLNLINNLGFKQITSEELNSLPYQPFVTDEKGLIWVIDKEKILKSLKK